MRVSMRGWLSPTSRLRLLGDLAWLTGLAVVGVLLLGGGSRDRRGLQSGVRLELIAGKQLRGLYLGKRRVGAARQHIERRAKGWRITDRYYAQVAGGKPEQIAWARLTLREDLSLEALSVGADPQRLATLTGLGPDIAKRLELGRLTLTGRCRIDTGECQISGQLGRRIIDQKVATGRGPVVPAALLPLLARGVLGNKAELVVFDPLTLRRRVITYQIVARAKLKLDGVEYDAIHVKQDVEGTNTDLWMDTRGRLLQETLPLGVVVKHERWE